LEVLKKDGVARKIEVMRKGQSRIHAEVGFAEFVGITSKGRRKEKQIFENKQQFRKLTRDRSEIWQRASFLEKAGRA